MTSRLILVGLLLVLPTSWQQEQPHLRDSYFPEGVPEGLRGASAREARRRDQEALRNRLRAEEEDLAQQISGNYLHTKLYKLKTAWEVNLK